MLSWLWVVVSPLNKIQFYLKDYLEVSHARLYSPNGNIVDNWFEDIL